MSTTAHPVADLDTFTTSFYTMPWRIKAEDGSLPIGSMGFYTERGFLVTSDILRDISMSDWYHGTHTSEGHVTVKKALALPQTNIELDQWHWPVQTWSAGPNKIFSVTETGSHIFKSIAMDIESRASTMYELSRQEKKPILLPYPPGFFESILFHHRLEWASERRVGDKYLLRKSDGLTEDDIRGLRAITTMMHPFVDAFVVFQNQKLGDKAIFSFSQDELYSKIALTIRLSYGWSGVSAHALRADGYNPGNQLPFMWKIPGLPTIGSENVKIRDKFIKLFAGKRVAEITRYAKLENIPRAMHAQLLLNLVLRAREQGIERLIVSVNDASAILFSAYGFKFLADLDYGQETRPEYLLYLDLDSTQMEESIELLAGEAQDLVISR